MKFGGASTWMACLVLAAAVYDVKTFPHQSSEESTESTESEVELVIVVPVSSLPEKHSAEVVDHSGDVGKHSGEVGSHESHETKSHEDDDRGSVSTSDEESEPSRADDLARFADDDSGASGEQSKVADRHPKLAEDEATKSVHHPKMIVDAAEMAEVEPKSGEEKEEAKGGGDDDESDEDDPSVRFPKTESLCPARPEEITKIEAECAEEYKQWKAMKAKKFAQQTAVEKTTEATTTTTEATTTTTVVASTTAVPTTTVVVETTAIVTEGDTTTELIAETARAMEVNLEGPEDEVTTHAAADQLQESPLPTSASADSQDSLPSLTTTLESPSAPMEASESLEALEPVDLSDLVEPVESVEGELPGTEEASLVEASTTPWSTTSTSELVWMGRRRRSSRKVIKKRSCYPATCILRKLNLLDSMGQPSIERIQSFAINMTVDETTNLEQKAVGCVKEINEAMIDASGDIGKKVGCVAQKVITCLNKGLVCPIMKVPQ